MFTGIIEDIGTITHIINEGGNTHFNVHATFANELEEDQSVAHDGVCLTVTQVNSLESTYQVTAIEETLKKSSLGKWRQGSKINLERAATLNARLDGHMVQGHVDAVGICHQIETKEGSWELTFSFPKVFSTLMVEKGSICINGISLTAFEVTKESFKVAIIPYTWDHTTMSQLKEGDHVNLEFDVIGKYVARYMDAYHTRN